MGVWPSKPGSDKDGSHSSVGSEKDYAKDGSHSSEDEEAKKPHMIEFYECHKDLKNLPKDGSIPDRYRKELDKIRRPVEEVESAEPEDEAALIALIKKAAEDGRQIRAIGAGHSFPRSQIYPGDGVLIKMTNFKKLEIDEKTMQATVGTGWRLGFVPSCSYHPEEPWEGSLNYKLNERGMAFSNLGSMSHHLIAGFFSGGTMGPSSSEPFGHAITRIRLIDGTGEAHEFLRPEPDENGDVDTDDPFFGVGLSNGLMGIITEFTVRCDPAFNLVGSANTCALEDTVEMEGVDIYAMEDTDKALCLKSYLEQNEYSKQYFWPQEQINKIWFWKGHKETPEDRKEHHEMYDDDGKFKPKYLEELSLVQQYLSNKMLNLLPAMPWGKFYQGVASFLANIAYIDEKEPFWGVWFKAIPNDNDKRDQLMPVEFTEICIDMNDAGKIMNILKEYWSHNEGWERTGIFITEFRTAPQTDFWIAPSVNGRILRIDMFFLYREKDPDGTTLFQGLWDYLDEKEVVYRAHWSKHVPEGYASRASELYPKIEKFRELRRKMDPHNIFLTDYWRSRLIGED